jgi:hypothetical protein
MDQAAIDAYKKSEKSKPAMIQALKAPNPTPANLALTNKLAHYYMSQLLLPDNQNLPKNVTDRFISDVYTQGVSDPVRQAMLKEVMVLVPTLLDHPEVFVRMNAVLFLNYCSDDKGTATVNPPIPPKPFVASHPLLGPIAKDKTQPWVVRNTAVVGLQRIFSDGTASNHSGLNTPTRSAIATDLLQVLSDALEIRDSEPLSWWYRYRAVEALGYSERFDLTTGQPAIIEALMARMSDRKEHFVVRSQAALSLSRIPWSAGVNEPLIMEEVAELMIDLSAAQAKAPEAVVWRQCFLRVYLAFRPADQIEANRKWGFLYKTAPAPAATNALWKASFPILKPFFEQRDPLPPAIAETAVDPIKKLIETKQTNRKVHPQATTDVP